MLQQLDTPRTGDDCEEGKGALPVAGRANGFGGATLARAPPGEACFGGRPLPRPDGGLGGAAVAAGFGGRPRPRLDGGAGAGAAAVAGFGGRPRPRLDGGAGAAAVARLGGRPRPRLDAGADDFPRAGGLSGDADEPRDGNMANTVALWAAGDSSASTNASGEACGEGLAAAAAATAAAAASNTPGRWIFSSAPFASTCTGRGSGNGVACFVQAITCLKLPPGSSSSRMKSKRRPASRAHDTW